MPKKNKHYARYAMLKTRPEVGEAIVAYTTRLQEKAHDCEFGDTYDEIILEHLIQTIENTHLIQKCISKSWTLQQFLTDAGQIEDVSIQVHDMNTDPAYQEIARIKSLRNNQKSRDLEFDERDKNAKYCTYCGLIGAHQRENTALHMAHNVTFARSLTTFHLCVEQTSSKKAIMDQKSPRRYSQKKKPSIKRADEVDSSSDTSLDEYLLEKSLMHMQIKTVSDSTAEKKDNISSRGIQLLQGKVS